MIIIINICLNTFIQFIKQEKYKQLGFSTHDSTDRLFNPIHWFQFADDAAVVTTDERENQLLLNCLTKWCQWANMIIKVDECITWCYFQLSMSLSEPIRKRILLLLLFAGEAVS